MEPGQILCRSICPGGIIESIGRRTRRVTARQFPSRPASDADETIGHMEHTGVSPVVEVITREPGQNLAGVTDREVLTRFSVGETGALPPGNSSAGQWPVSDTDDGWEEEPEADGEPEGGRVIPRLEWDETRGDTFGSGSVFSPRKRF